MNIFERISQALGGHTQPSSSTQNTQQAKELFFSYDCRTFFMAHDGVYEEYKQHHVSYEQEQEWRSEFIQHWSSQIDSDDLTALRHLWHAGATEALPLLLAKAQQGDSYIKMWFASAIWDIADTNPTRYQGEQAAAIVIWRGLLDQPITLTAAHRAEIAIALKKNQTDEEYIRDHARHGLVLKAKQRI